MDVMMRFEFDLVIDEGDGPVMNETLGDIQQDARAILEEGGQEMVEAAQEIAPVKTGALMMSIYYEVQDVTGLTFGADISYASYVEEGTVKMKGRQFLAVVANEYVPMIQEQLDEMIAERLAQDTSEDDPEFEFERSMEELEG
jgi:hypothetical protein